MPTNLRERAENQLGRFEALTTAVRTRLGEVHQELDRRDPEPDLRELAEWQAAFGAAQHLQVARARLSENRADQVATRIGLAAVETPAEAGPQRDVLRDLMIAEATYHLEVRAAEERVAIAGSLIESLGALAAKCSAASAAAAERLAWGTEHQTLGQRLRQALTVPPLASLVADANALAAGAAFTAANTRLAALLPAELRTRATTRRVEARSFLDAHEALLVTADDAVDNLTADARPVDAAMATATAALLSAERMLDAYIGRAAGRLAAASASLTRIAAHPALRPAQSGALAAAGRVEAVAAAGLEATLTAAFDAVAAAQRGVDDAILTALAENPDRDPETDADVIAARATLNGAALQDPLADARAAYDDAARQALDEWEVEVPPSLWDALADFLDTAHTLDGLGDQPARDALVTGLDAATDAFAAARDAADVAERTALQLSWRQGERRAVAVAVEQTTPSRFIQYVRGYGGSGRTTVEI
jgi:hypothetical protein